MSQPNIILVMTDQQRWDTLGSVGADWAKTPNLDALAARGTPVRKAFVQSTVSGPSRASIVSGQYVHHHGAADNGQWLRPDAPNWIEQLRDAGYHTANVGKMHTVPTRLQCGFDHRWIVENKNHPPHPYGSDMADHYHDWLADQGLRRPALDYHRTVADWAGTLNATVWPLEDDLFPDNVVGRRSVDYIAHHDFDKPLFLWSGFAGPHDPFDVPRSTLDEYGNPRIPPPVAAPGELDTKPPSQRAYMEWMTTFDHPAAIDWNRATPAAIARVRRHYHANVMLIDQWVGRIVDALTKRGQLENTIIVFTSDHGEALWDHSMVYKFASHYEPVVGVPLLAAGPGVDDQPIRDAIVEMIDLGPTLLDYAGVDADPRMDGRSIRPMLQGHPASPRDAAFSSYGNRRMVRTPRWKLIRYTGEPLGELYDLAADPDELINRWDDPTAQATRAALEQLLDVWLAN